MRKLLLPVVIIFIMVWATPATANLDVRFAAFSNNLEVDETYSWNIENYQVGNSRIETKSSPTSFEFIHGSRIELTVLQDATDINLAANRTLSGSTILSDYFDLVYDDISYDWERADQLFIWVFPPTAIADDGSTINILSEFWIYTLYNLLKNGETFEFNSSLPPGDVSTSTDDDELIITFEPVGASIQARIDSASGIMNAVNFVSDVPDFRIEIDRRGGGSGALPISPIWSIIPLIALPLIYRKIWK